MQQPTNDPMLEGGESPRGISRRGLLAGAGALGAALVLAACGSDSNDASSSTTSPATTGATSPPTTGAATTAAPTTAAAPDMDAKLAMLAAGLEVLAVGTYQAALAAATAGKLGEVPPAVATFVTTARDQHQQQLDAWNKVLTGAGASAVDEPNATLKPTVDAAFAKVTDVAGAAQLARQLEQIAAATYLSAIEVLESKDAIELAGSIHIIDMQHAAILNFVLGEYPVPDTFAMTEMAVSA